MTATLDITDMMPGGHAPARSDEPRSIPATSDWADAVRALETAAAALAAISPADLPAHGLGEDLLRLNRTARVLESATAGAAHRFAHSDDWAADGARSPHAWIQGRSNDTCLTARLPIDRGGFMESFSAVAAAWRSGDIGAQHIDVLRRLFRKHPRLQPALIAVDDAIAVTATACEPHEFGQRLRELCHRADPDAVDESDREQRRHTYLHAFTLLDGFVHITGILDPVLGAQLVNALESARRDLPPPADDTAGVPFVDNMDARPTPHVAEAHRPIGQVNLDALHRILDAACSATDDLTLPLVTGERPTLNITIALTALTGADPTVMGWLERFGLPAATITARLTEQIACDASLRPLVVDRHGDLVAMLPRARTIHPALRRAVFTRDIHCRFPNCRQRIDEIHHITYHSHGGPTTMHNLVGLCWFHHHTIHDRGWHITGDPNSQLHFTSPTRRHATSDPPNRR